MSRERYTKRHSQLQRQLLTGDLDALVLNPGPDLAYLTGLSFHLMERPVIGIFVPDREPIFILPELEAGKLNELPYQHQSFSYSEDRSAWPQAFKKAIRAGNLTTGTIGMIPRRLRVLELNYLEDAASGADFVDGGHMISPLRMKKDGHERNAMRKAAAIAQQAFLAIQDTIKPGITEKALAARLVSQLLDMGSDPNLPFFPIVSFGSNSANPHATPTEKPLAENQLLLIDWGATVDGYHSDITRTFAVGHIDHELQHIADLVHKANRAGRTSIRPGTRCSNLDQNTRTVIEQAGYGEHFLHRTGHGLGREAHEEPYIAADDPTILAAGMTFTIEPGIYLPGKGGVRIEDDVVVTEEGHQSFTDLPRELRKIWPR